MIIKNLILNEQEKKMLWLLKGSTCYWSYFKKEKSQLKNSGNK
jgi:hypothetical protein